MPGQLGGHNVTMERILNSKLNQKYDFRILNQDRVAGGKFSISLIYYLKKKIEEVNPDIIHISGLQSAGFHAILAARLAKCRRIVLTIHGFEGDALKLSYIKKWAFNNIIEPITLKMADVVIGNSQYTVTRPMVKKYARKHTVVIYNLPPNPYVPKKNEISVRKELGLKDDDILVVYVGRITYDKGLRILAEAIKHLSNYKEVKFLIVGDGDYKSTLMNLLSEEIKKGVVFMLGARNDVQRILHGCDIFVLPSFHETLSNVTLEASAEGLAIVVSNVGGLKEIIVNNYNGILIPPGNSFELSRAIKYFIDNPGERKRMGLNARKRIEEKFNSDSIIQKLDQIYENLLKGKD